VNQNLKELTALCIRAETRVDRFVLICLLQDSDCYGMQRSSRTAPRHKTQGRLQIPGTRISSRRVAPQVLWPLHRFTAKFEMDWSGSSAASAPRNCYVLFLTTTSSITLVRWCNPEIVKQSQTSSLHPFLPSAREEGVINKIDDQMGVRTLFSRRVKGLIRTCYSPVLALL